MPTDDKYHELCDTRNKEILLDLAENSPNETTKEIILSYDVDKDESEIYRAMDKKLKGQLSETAEYLKIDVTQMLKDDITKSILSKLNASLLERCAKCSIYYHVATDAEPIAKCACGQHCHYNCYKDIVEIFNKFPGVVFQCSHCSATPPNIKPGKTSKPTTPKPTTVEPPADETKDDADSNPDKAKSTLNIKVVESFNLEVLQNRFPQPSYDICEDYKRFNCPHGRNGLTEVNGDICRNLHPKKCFRWMRAFKNEVHGCNEGSECPYYHPVICRNSLRYKKCLKPDCTYTHLQNTKRYERSRQRSEYSNYRDSQPEQPARPPSTATPWAENKEREPENSPPQNNTAPKDESVRFLGDLIQSIKLDMKTLHKELSEVKKSQETKVPQPQQQIPQYMHIAPYMYNMPNQINHAQTNQSAQTMQFQHPQFLAQRQTSYC